MEDELDAAQLRQTSDLNKNLRAGAGEGSLLHLYESRLRRLKQYEEIVYSRYHGAIPGELEEDFFQGPNPADNLNAKEEEEQKPSAEPSRIESLSKNNAAAGPPSVINIDDLETGTYEDISVSTGLNSLLTSSIIEPKSEMAQEEQDGFHDDRGGESQGTIHNSGIHPSGHNSNNTFHVSRREPSKEEEEDNNGSDENDTINRAYTYQASSDSKFEEYSCLIDPKRDDRAVEIMLYSAKRPHMRAFHLSWLGFFAAFFNWFGIAPLMSQVAHSLRINRTQVWTANTMAVVGSFITRVMAGPLNDIYGSRVVISVSLLISAVPAILSGVLIHGAVSLYIVRFLVGIAGCVFVTCQFWTASMFTTEVAGTALSLTAGWGNLGGGFSHLVMGSLLFPLFNLLYGGDGYKEVQSSVFPNDTNFETNKPSDRAWRTILAIPGILSLVVAYLSFKHADDTPKGNLGKRKKLGLITQESVSKALGRAANDKNTWLMFFQYGCCFGVELTMTSAASLYFQEEFGQSTASAAAIASVFGWMNLFARGLGGFCSDMASARYGMRGRLWVQMFTLFCQGGLVCVFSVTSTLTSAIAVMALFSIFVQAAEGSSFAIVPYINHDVTGSISGIVGAGGNFGAIAFSLIFRQTQNRTAFFYMGCAVVASSLLCAFVTIDGHRSLFFGEDATEVKERRSAHAGQLGKLPTVDFRNSEMQKRRNIMAESSVEEESRRTFDNDDIISVHGASFDDVVSGTEVANA
ncbi:unnamed protein product [Cylindrotheca closterium]|uniref:Major facilitator superfamily (MFS) profile domain-containing protein n=1 Tax=Cylindrotheca closterium TaxID=2856 RepID=A0AAD2CFW7_9STRA|nr:unnamed protein product [Cylindrotheca closterium]